MAKKNRIKAADRQKQNAAAKAGWAEREAQKKAELEAEEKAKREAAEKAEREKLLEKIKAEKAARGEKTKHKSSAKAAGLKSTFTVGDEHIMTSFGRGNKAVVEKSIKDGNVSDISAEKAFSLTGIDDCYYHIQSSRANSAEGQTDKPDHSEKRAGTDMIHCRDVLEQLYFGKTFDDNIHIQLIYNILDIEKILAEYINNIIYTLDNVNRGGNYNFFDFIGYLSVRNSFAVFSEPEKFYSGDLCDKIKKSKAYFDEFIKNPRLRYFGSAFYETPSDKKAKPEDKLKSAEDIYYYLCFIGSVRQMLAHSTEQNVFFKNKYSNAYLYNIDDSKLPDGKDGTDLGAAVRNLLKKTYQVRIAEINKGFVANSKKDLTVIFGLCGARTREQKAAFAADYYDFCIKKQQKNLGFSIKKLREAMLDLIRCDVRNDKYNADRSRIYKHIDFCIFEYFKENADIAQQLVDELRSAADDDDKERIYIAFADEAGKKLCDTVGVILNAVNGEAIGRLEPDGDIDEALFDGCLIGDEADYFSMAIYALTLLLDGKEINTLLSALLNKFENIAAFIDVINELNLGCKFEKAYEMFARSEKIAEELRLIMSFARMQKCAPKAKRMLYVEAAQLLGDSRSEDELCAYFDTVLGKPEKNKKAESKTDNSLRNFICNNVIASSRFNYLVRYCSPIRVRSLAGNKSVVRFALKGIPETQLERYFKAVGGTGTDKLEYLADLISKMNFGMFENVKQNDRTSTYEEKQQKEQFKAIISLYLTVLYLLVKNLVYVNSRYFIAFHCLERDSRFLEKETEKTGEIGKAYSYCTLTQMFIDKGWLNEHAKSYLEVNIRNSDEAAIRSFRNSVAHIGAVRNPAVDEKTEIKFDSYFELYHYIMQAELESSFARNGFERVNEKTKRYAGLYKKYNSCCKDFVKALCAPFGYNLPRFKNLTIDGLFDMNDTRDKPKKSFIDEKIEKEEGEAE